MCGCPNANGYLINNSAESAKPQMTGTIPVMPEAITVNARLGAEAAGRKWSSTESEQNLTSSQRKRREYYWSRVTENAFLKLKG